MFSPAHSIFYCYKSVLCKCYELKVKCTFAFCKTSELLLLQKTNHLHGAHQRKKKNNVFFSNTHWPNLKGTHFIQYFLQPPFASLWKCLIRLEKTSSLLPFFSFREFLFCEGQQSFAAHQKYILWFYSLRWMELLGPTVSIPKCPVVFLFLYNYAVDPF